MRPSSRVPRKNILVFFFFFNSPDPSFINVIPFAMEGGPEEQKGEEVTYGGGRSGPRSLQSWPLEEIWHHHTDKIFTFPWLGKPGLFNTYFCLMFSGNTPALSDWFSRTYWLGTWQFFLRRTLSATKHLSSTKNIKFVWFSSKERSKFFFFGNVPWVFAVWVRETNSISVLGA